MDFALGWVKWFGVQEKLEKLMPKRVKKKRPIQNEDGDDAGWEVCSMAYCFPPPPEKKTIITAIVCTKTNFQWQEYYDYVFPEEGSSSGALKIL